MVEEAEKLKLTFQETEELLDSILNNQMLQKIEISSGPRFVVFSFPTAQEIMVSRFMRDKTQAEAAAEGLPTLEELEKNIRDRNLFGDLDIQIEEIQDKIKGQQAILDKTQIPARRSSLEEIIDKFKLELLPLQSKKESIYYLCQERKGDEVSYLYLTWASTYNIEGKKLWDSFDLFEKEQDIFFRTEVLSAFTKFNAGLPAKTIRYLARHSLWRIRFVAALKTGAGESLFSRPFHDLTPDQLGLLYWSNYYQSIYDMLPDDQPSQEIIEDDEKLDKYMEEFFKQKESERNEGKAEKRSSNKGVPKGYQTKLDAWKTGQELIITPSHPDYQNLAYTEQRVKAAEGVSEVEIIAPNSRRARNRRARNRGKSPRRPRGR